LLGHDAPRNDSNQNQNTGAEIAPVFFYSRPPVGLKAALDGFWRLDFLETQKAPSRIAPTKNNAAHAASTLSFIVRSTRRTSIAVVLTKV
jgi:hypothetical protein